MYFPATQRDNLRRYSVDSIARKLRLWKPGLLTTPSPGTLQPSEVSEPYVEPVQSHYPDDSGYIEPPNGYEIPEANVGVEVIDLSGSPAREPFMPHLVLDAEPVFFEDADVQQADVEIFEAIEEARDSIDLDSGLAERLMQDTELPLTLADVTVEIGFADSKAPALAEPIDPEPLDPHPTEPEPEPLDLERRLDDPLMSPLFPPGPMGF